MKSILVAFLAISALRCDDVELDDNVHVLTDANFKDFLANNEFVFVKFYAPWCGHCKKMAPGYAKLGKRMIDENSNVKIAKLDATVHKEAATEHGIQGFPTLKFFINGTPVDYQGAREEDAIYNWIQKKTGPASKELTSDDDLKTHSASKLSVMYFLPKDDDEALKGYMGFAAAYDDVSFAHSHDPEHAKSFEVTNKYGFVVFRTFDDGHKFLVDDAALSADKMKSFFESHRYPIVSEFDQEAANRIFGGQMKCLILLRDGTDTEEEKAFREFAKENQKEDLVFSVSAVSSGFGQRLAEYIGVKEGPTARFITFEGGQLNKYVVNDLTPEGLKKALEDFKAGTLAVHYKSSPVPETNDEPVKVVVGDTFEELVLTEDKFVLLEAYAPWCGHCKKLEPIYKDLAEKLSGEEKIVIAKMDATENEHPLMPVSGFPTLRLFKPGSKTPVDYQGDRSLDDLMKFLKDNTGLELEAAKEATEEL